MWDTPPKKKNPAWCHSRYSGQWVLGTMVEGGGSPGLSWEVRDCRSASLGQTRRALRAARETISQFTGTQPSASCHGPMHEPKKVGEFGLWPVALRLCAQGSFLAVLEGPYVMLGVKLGTALYKTNAFLAVPSHQLSTLTLFSANSGGISVTCTQEHLWGCGRCTNVSRVSAVCITTGYPLLPPDWHYT